ncbi:MAG: hypothetical protein IPM35_39585 [Myxococcales bacterium]|nr:hypothetical protein [Myxococcales bacterium]
MSPALVVAASVLFVVVLVVVARQFVHRLRARGRAALERFAPSDVVLSELMAQSYGEESRGATQARGNGALALTKDELFFLLYVPERELRIPLASIEAVTMPRSHLGKTSGAKLLHVRFRRDAGQDAVAWRVLDPEAWKFQLDALRPPPERSAS